MLNSKCHINWFCVVSGIGCGASQWYKSNELNSHRWTWICFVHTKWGQKNVNLEVTIWFFYFHVNNLCCLFQFALHVYTRLREVGERYDLRHTGYYAMRALRVEKFFCVLGSRFGYNYHPLRMWQIMACQIWSKSPHKLLLQLLKYI